MLLENLKHFIRKNKISLLRERWNTLNGGVKLPISDQSHLKKHLFIIERTFWYPKFGLKFLKCSTEIWNTFKKVFFGVFTIFWLSGFFRDFLKIPGIFGKSPGFGIFFQSRDFYPRDFHPRDSGFFLVSGFSSPGFGIFF